MIGISQWLAMEEPDVFDREAGRRQYTWEEQCSVCGRYFRGPIGTQLCSRHRNTDDLQAVDIDDGLFELNEDGQPEDWDVD